MSIFDFFNKKKNGGTPIPPSVTKPETVRKEEVQNQLGNVSAKPASINSHSVEMLQKTFIALDVETTGENPEEDRIIEIGAVRYVDGNRVDKFNTLVNQKLLIPREVSSVNHITNDMLMKAPTEREALMELLLFLGEATSKKTILCAHHARHVLGFLVNALKRQGYDGDFIYVDTLDLSIRFIKGLENYRQETIERHLGLINGNTHRALDDAKIAGKILCGLMNEMVEEVESQIRTLEKCTPSEEEMEICAYIQKLIHKQCEDVSWLRYQKNTGNYVEVICLSNVVKFKILKKGKYIIVDAKKANKTTLVKEACIAAEGAPDLVRVYFSNVKDLDQLSDYIVELYKERYQSMKDFINSGEQEKQAADESLAMMNQIRIEDEEKLALLAEEREDTPPIVEKNTDAAKKLKRSILQLNDKGKLLQKFGSAAEASRAIGVSAKGIRDCANGNQKHAGGFCWKYEDSEK